MDVSSGPAWLAALEKAYVIQAAAWERPKAPLNRLISGVGTL